MKKTWKEVKGLVKETSVDNDNIDMRTGECIVDLIGGKYDGWSVTGKIIKAIGEYDWDEVVIDDDAIVYNPAE